MTYTTDLRSRWIVRRLFLVLYHEILLASVVALQQRPKYPPFLKSSGNAARFKRCRRWNAYGVSPDLGHADSIAPATIPRHNLLCFPQSGTSAIACNCRR